MFNSPILEVTIGLVFIFLLYSLLATAIIEAIASLFGLRARMLRNAIVERMLANSTEESKWFNAKWVSIFKGTWELIREGVFVLTGKIKPDSSKDQLGQLFYNHPLIKNYGSSGVFPLPSYLTAKNFSTILIDVLKQDFDTKKPEISAYKVPGNAFNKTTEEISADLEYSTDMIKIREVIDYYDSIYSTQKPLTKEELGHASSGEKKDNTSDNLPQVLRIDKETLRVIQLHLSQSGYDIEKFNLKIENWFDDTMDRVSGWYKRQTQAVLFVIGISMAITFNVDTIGISRKLSIDHDAREQLVQHAILAIDKYKDDPAVSKAKNISEETQAVEDSLALLAIQKQHAENQSKLNTILKSREKDIHEANDILALGWGDYQTTKKSEKILLKYARNNLLHQKNGKYVIDSTSTPEFKQQVLDSLYVAHPYKYKVGHVLSQSMKGKKLLGFLITALAISLGAPFWFDLLNKLVKIRASGKKEDSGDSNKVSGSNQASQPITVNVNTQNNDEAVG